MVQEAVGSNPTSHPTCPMMPRHPAARSALFLILAVIYGLPGAATAFWDPLTAQCQGEPLEGSASAIDGDTLELTTADGGRVVIHLYTLSAPELFQECRDNAGPWSCGREARASLDDLVAGREFACTPCGRDGYGALEALCRDGDLDLNAEVLRSGFATTQAFFSNALHAAETQARLAGRGLWRGDWVHPQAWRDGARLGSGPCQGCMTP